MYKSLELLEAGTRLFKEFRPVDDYRKIETGINPAIVEGLKEYDVSREKLFLRFIYQLASENTNIAILSSGGEAFGFTVMSTYGEGKCNPKGRMCTESTCDKSDCAVTYIPKEDRVYIGASPPDCVGIRSVDLYRKGRYIDGDTFVKIFTKFKGRPLRSTAKLRKRYRNLVYNTMGIRDERQEKICITMAKVLKKQLGKKKRKHL